MDRRLFVTAAAVLAAPAVRAHHGWSSFDQSRPVWLEGKVAAVAWRNPHAEFQLDLRPDLRLPADLPQRSVPPQVAAVDGPALLKAAQLPTRRDRRWEVELAPLARLEAWKVPPLRVGDEVGVLGFTFAEEKGAAIVRAEYLFAGGRAFGMRSAPA